MIADSLDCSSSDRADVMSRTWSARRDDCAPVPVLDPRGLGARKEVAQHRRQPGGVFQVREMRRRGRDSKRLPGAARWAARP